MYASSVSPLSREMIEKIGGNLINRLGFGKVKGGKKKELEMGFLTNNFSWSATTIADLYRCRWQIEVFFKEIKQTLQLKSFLGHNENAVKWQIRTALLLYVLVRYIGNQGD
jgi:IS4 transposase